MITNLHNGVKPPFGWVGGKSRIAPEIIKRFPEHRLYVEVFAGSLAVLYAKTRSKIEVVNDIDDDLIALHRVIQSRPVALADALERLLISRRRFEDVRDRKIEPRNIVERAAWKFYLIALSFSSNCGSFGMRKRKARTLIRDWSVASRRLKRVCIESLHYERLITQYDSEDTLFYLDPPYVARENYYRGSLDGGFGRADHERLAAILRGIKGRFVLSYNDHALVRELYAGFKIEELPHRYSLNGAARKQQVVELVISG